MIKTMKLMKYPEFEIIAPADNTHFVRNDEKPRRTWKLENKNELRTFFLFFFWSGSREKFVWKTQAVFKQIAYFISQMR